MSSADIAACFPSEHDALLGDVESRRRSSKPFYLTRSSLETRKKEQGGLAGWWARFGEGGTIFDAFLMEASQQVGQSLLTLPWAFSLMGYGWAITSLLGLSLISMWTQHLLIALHAEYRMRLAQDKEHPRHGDEDYIASYHEVFGYLMNKWWGRFSVVIVFLALLGLTVAQIIATSSNLYLLNESLPKRTYAIICGAVFSLLSFLPTFRHYRLFVLVGLIATFYTACFLTFNAISRGPNEGISHDSPTRKQKFFTGFSDLLFMFGGHTAAIEKADVMDSPKIYDYAYALATIYVYVITLPTGIAGFHTFGRTAQGNSNAFYMYAKSPARDLGLGLMCFHEFVAFGLFAGPLWHMWEKFLKVDKSHYLVRTASRYIVNAFMVLFAVMFPFFGVINSVQLSVEVSTRRRRVDGVEVDSCPTQVLGAFTTTFGSFLIPALAWNLYYNSDERIKAMPKPIALGLNVSTVKVMNWVFILIILVLGLGMGGWASIKTMDEKVKEFELFDRCNGC